MSFFSDFAVIGEAERGERWAGLGAIEMFARSRDRNRK